jgi:hypothetical protein
VRIGGVTLYHRAVIPSLGLRSPVGGAKPADSSLDGRQLALSLLTVKGLGDTFASEGMRRLVRIHNGE